MAQRTVLLQNCTIIYHSNARLQQGSTYGFIRLEGVGCAEKAAGSRLEEMNKALRTRLFAWWYFAIAAGFALLGINRWILGERMWLVGLRFGIAAGFLILGILTWRSKA